MFGQFTTITDAQRKLVFFILKRVLRQNIRATVKFICVFD